MYAYFKYLRLCLFTKVSIWLACAINWLFTFIILLIVPAVAKLAPMNIWNFDKATLQSIYIIANSAVSAFLTVYIFRSGIEDQTELVIMSKPIKRQSIMIVKFLWTFIFGVIVALGNCFIAIFTLCFGQYDPITNVSGMEYDKLLPLMGSLIIGTVIVTMVFDSLGIFIATWGNKIQIIVGIIATAIAFTVYSVIAQTLIVSVSKTINEQIGSEPKSFQIKKADGTYQNFVFISTLKGADMYETYKKIDMIGNRVASYLNFDGQLVKLYSLFGVNDINETLSSAKFGEYQKLDVKIKSKNDTLLKFYLDNWNNEKSKQILSMPYYSSMNSDTNKIVDGKPVVPHPTDYSFNNISLNLGTLSFYKFLGAEADTIFISNYEKYMKVPSTLYSIRELNKIAKGKQEAFDKEVFETIGRRILDEKCDPEYAELPKIVNNDDSYTLQTKFTNLCFKFIKEKATEYQLDVNDVENLNLSFAKVKYSLIKTFIDIYWSQIFKQIMDKNNLSAEELLTNVDHSFINSFSSEIEVVNPYNSSDIIVPLDNGFHLYDFLHVYYAYTSCAIYGDNRAITDYLKQGTSFANSSYGMDMEGNPNKKNPLKKDDELYYQFTCRNQTFSSSVTFNNIYAYTTKEIVDNKTAVIVWTIVSLMVSTLSIIKFTRFDIV